MIDHAAAWALDLQLIERARFRQQARAITTTEI